MRKGLKITLTVLLISSVVLLFAVALSLSIIYSLSKNENFDKDKLINTDLKIELYDQNNELISEKNTFNNQYIKISSLNPETLEAFISIEDKNFYSHSGINPKRMVKAMLKNLKNGHAVQGASTISQQLIKNTHLSSEKTYSRKMKEISLALQMEKELTKDEILENYLNIIYYGNNIYGIENASNFYFSKSASDLSLVESATLAALIKAPSNYDPITKPEKCLQRRNLVLLEMKRDGKISEEEYQTAIGCESGLNIDENFSNGQNSYSQGAIDEAIKLLNMPAKQIAIGEYKIYTYHNPGKQKSLTNALQTEGLECDVAGISVNNKTYGVEAFYGESAFSILKAKRQPGSTVKPILVYGPAINENKISPATKILDEEIDINGYKPQNVSKTFSGYVSVREAMSKSLNIPAVKVLSYVGIEKAKRYGERFGIEFDENDIGYALALGGMTYGTNIKTLAGAYSSFANNGKFAEAKFISKIEDKNGKTIYERKISIDQVLREDASYLTLSTLQSCVSDGLCKKLSVLPFQVAGKTGTVGKDSVNHDAYNVALTSEDTIAVWAGNLNGEEIGRVLGGLQPTNISKNYFSKIYTDHTPADFEIPTSITQVDIDSSELDNNHIVVRANNYVPDKNKVTEVFSRFNLPREKQMDVLNATPAKLSGKVQNDIVLLEFDAESLLTYELYRNNQLVETFIGRAGKTSYSEPNPAGKSNKYFLVTKLKNYSTGEETSSEQSNIVEILGSKAVPQPTENQTQNSNKWYL